MHPHHAESIHNVVAHFQQRPEVAALLLGGSIAHGFAGPASDVDVLIVISDEAYQERLARGDLTFYTREFCSYPEGYVDGKYLRPAFLRQVAERGSEPARFAFLDAQVLFSRIETIDDMLRDIVRYPVAGKTERMRRFRGQLEAWHWYAHEALRLDNRYLLGVAIGKLVLFGGRLILAHNEVLHPYHKWFLTVLRRVEQQPADLFDRIERLYDAPSRESVTAFYDTVLGFQDWPELELGWGNRFMLDSELNWLNGATPVDDL
jgi:predicted nucleotidyltransferase